MTEPASPLPSRTAYVQAADALSITLNGQPPPQHNPYTRRQLAQGQTFLPRRGEHVG